MLLSDETTAKWLDERFVLSWEQIRPTAKVNIDFGNGHKMERTLVGNTCFVIALPDGTVVDALPGVYTPNDFVEQVTWSYKTAQTAMASQDPSRVVREAHEKKADRTFELDAVTMLSKTMVEAPLMMSLGLTAERTDAQGAEIKKPLPGRAGEFEEADIKAFVSAVGDKIEDLSKRPATSTSLRSSRHFNVAGKPTPEQVIAADSRANVKYMRPAIHLLLSTNVQAQNKDDLGRTLFKDLLHIDIDDPYLGLRDMRIPGADGQE